MIKGDNDMKLRHIVLIGLSFVAVPYGSAYACSIPVLCDIGRGAGDIVRQARDAVTRLGVSLHNQFDRLLNDMRGDPFGNQCMSGSRQAISVGIEYFVTKGGFKSRILHKTVTYCPGVPINNPLPHAGMIGNMHDLAQNTLKAHQQGATDYKICYRLTPHPPLIGDWFGFGRFGKC